MLYAIGGIAFAAALFGFLHVVIASAVEAGIRAARK